MTRLLVGPLSNWCFIPGKGRKFGFPPQRACGVLRPTFLINTMATVCSCHQGNAATHFHLVSRLRTHEITCPLPHTVCLLCMYSIVCIVIRHPSGLYGRRGGPNYLGFRTTEGKFRGMSNIKCYHSRLK